MLSLFTLEAAAQEPTVEPTSLPTPTPAATWTPTTTPTHTPDPAATPTTGPAGPTPSGESRTVDFRVDDDRVEKGNCATFSWIVRGDVDRVEFDTLGDGKVAVLVSHMDSREECPAADAEYRLVVAWLDGAQSERSIEVKINGDEGGGGDSSGAAGGAVTPAASSVFIAVTPILITGTPVSAPPQASQPASDSGSSGGGLMAAPNGPLSSVSILPETGYRAPAAQSRDRVNTFQITQSLMRSGNPCGCLTRVGASPTPTTGPYLKGIGARVSLPVVVLGAALLGLAALVAKFVRNREVLR
jgi:hypothetical protein